MRAGGGAPRRPERACPVLGPRPHRPAAPAAAVEARYDVTLVRLGPERRSGVELRSTEPPLRCGPERRSGVELRSAEPPLRCEPPGAAEYWRDGVDACCAARKVAPLE